MHTVVKKELFKSGPKKMKFKKFLREYMYEDWYLSNIVPEEMMHELAVSALMGNYCFVYLFTFCVISGVHAASILSALWLHSVSDGE